MEMDVIINAYLLLEYYLGATTKIDDAVKLPCYRSLVLNHCGWVNHDFVY